MEDQIYILNQDFTYCFLLDFKRHNKVIRERFWIKLIAV